MKGATGWQHGIEVHPPDWNFPSGASWIAGWLRPGPGQAITDVRAWLDQRPFLGLHGLPRPDLEATLPGHAGPPHVGFSFLLTPQPRARRLRLEACDLAGQWHDFFETAVRTPGESAETPSTRLLAADIARYIPDLLRRAVRSPAIPWQRHAHEILAAELAWPLNALPNPPFVGALEEPAASGRVRHGRLSITGWLTHRTARIKRLTAVLDPLQEVTLPHGLARGDITDNFPELRDQADAAFVGQVDLPSALPAPVLLKIFAELESGEKHLVFAQRFVPDPGLATNPPAPPASRMRCARAALALWRAARRLGVDTAGTLFAAHHAWKQYPAPEAHGLVPQLNAAAEGRPLRILVVTHNLNFEGAPRLVFELSRFMAGHSGVSLRVISPQEGPMRRLFEEAGMPVEVLDLSGALASTSASTFHERMADTFGRVDWQTVDLVLANTLVSFWAVHLAERAGKPAVLYVHESAPIPRLFERLVDSVLFPVVEEAVRQARRVIFTADASRQIFAGLDRGHFRVLSSWLDVAGILRFTAENDKPSLRRKHRVDADALVILNLGTVCERKGQHVFVRAAALLEPEFRARYPDRRIEFIMVGAREDDFLQEIRARIRDSGLQRLQIVPETRENYDFHRLADILVCTSFEESSPRVLLEAASFGTPIVSTDVNGIPEIINGREAWLVPPGDHYHLAGALKEAVAAFIAGDKRRATRAHEKVIARYDERVSLPQHLAVIREAGQGRS